MFKKPLASVVSAAVLVAGSGHLSLISAAETPTLTVLIEMAGDAPAPVPTVAAGQTVGDRPLINGTDVSAAIGTYRMDSPQFGCPMTVYGRYEDGSFAVWTDGEADTPRRSKSVHGESDNMPRFHYMSTGQSHVFYKYAGGQTSYRRSANTRVESSGGGLSLYQESLGGMNTRGFFSTSSDEHEVSRRTIQFFLGGDGSMTLSSRQNDRRSEPPVCSFRKTSTEAGPAARRLIPYAFEAKVRVGGKAGVLRAAFDMEEFSDFERDTRLRNFQWEIALDGGETIAPELPLSDGDWRKNHSGWVSPGVAPLQLGGGIAGVLHSVLSRPLAGSFIVELEAGAYARLGGGDQLLRLFMACDETMTSCGLISSLIDGDDPGFFAPPFPKRADFPVRLDGDTLIELKRR